MKVCSLPSGALQRRLAGKGLGIAIGPFNVMLASPIPTVAQGVSQLYDRFELVEDGNFVDFRTALSSPSVLRRWFRPQVIFSLDGQLPFKPLPRNQAFAMFEWGLNWCVANSAHQYLIIHAAVAEKNGVTCIFPGAPGSGKSTLCAGLVSRGWRLLSDEMAMISNATGAVIPIPRPISLKNQSIEVIQAYSPQVTIGHIAYDTLKGTVAHMRPPDMSVERQDEPGMAGMIVFPKYQAEAETRLSPLDKSEAFLKLADNSFNYNVLGLTGFDTLARLIDGCDCYDFEYHDLDDARSTLESLLRCPTSP